MTPSKGEADRFASAHGAVEQMSVAGPTAVMNLDGAVGRRVILPFAVFEKLVGQPRGGAFGLRRRRVDVLGHRDRIGHLHEVDELDVEHGRPSRSAASGAPRAGEGGGDPESAFLPFRHRGQPLGQPRDDVVHQERPRLLIGDRAVDDLALRRPSREVDVHLVVGTGVLGSLPFRQDPPGQPGRGLRRLSRRLGHVGGSRRCGGADVLQRLDRLRPGYVSRRQRSKERRRGQDVPT